MPITPSTYSDNAPVTPQQLNLDLYSFDGGGMSAQGILFHTRRPVLLQTFIATQSVSAPTTGAWTELGGTEGDSFNVIDTAALFGPGSDNPGVFGTYRFYPAARGSSGQTPQTTSGTFQVTVAAGGWELLVHFVTAAAFSGAGSMAGAAWYQSGSVYSYGTIIAGSTGQASVAWALDLVSTSQPAPPATIPWQPAIGLQDPGGKANTLPVTNNTAGATPRMLGVWCGVNQNGATVASLPAPQQQWAGTTQVDAALLNSTIRDTLTFLNYPPMLRIGQGLGQSIPNTTITTMQFTAAPDIDNYAGFSASTYMYTVKIPGLYLAHATSFWSESSAGSIRWTRLAVNGTGYAANSYYPIQVSQPNVTQATMILDLQAGDTVSVQCYQTSGSSLGLASSPYDSRFVMAWLGSLAPDTTPLTWTVPDTRFHWTAGIPPSQLPGLLQQHLGNDLNFLMSRPYFTGYQSTAQGPFSATAGWEKVSIGTVGGIVHGSPGDNYAGWDATSNQYAPPVAGWYLVVVNVGTTLPSTTTTSQVWAGIGVTTSGGVASPLSYPDIYEARYVNGAGSPGATAVGCYYLDPAYGDAVSAYVTTTGYGTTWSTSPTQCQLSAIWMCA